MARKTEKGGKFRNRKACRIVPASLGEMIGDYAAISVGIKAYHDLYERGSFQFYDRVGTRTTEVCAG